MIEAQQDPVRAGAIAKLITASADISKKLPFEGNVSNPGATTLHLLDIGYVRGALDVLRVDLQPGAQLTTPSGRVIELVDKGVSADSLTTTPTSFSPDIGWFDAARLRE